MNSANEPLSRSLNLARACSWIPLIIKNINRRTRLKRQHPTAWLCTSYRLGNWLLHLIFQVKGWNMVIFTLHFASHHLASLRTIWMVLICDATALHIIPAGFQLHFHILPLPRSVFEQECLQFVLLLLLPLTVGAQPIRYSSILPSYWRMKYVLAFPLSKPTAIICG